MPPSSRLVGVDHLDGAQVAAVTALVERAAAIDGVPALNEAALLHLRHPQPGVEHFLVGAEVDPEEPRGQSGLIGYAQLDSGGPTATGELVVDPTFRRRGVGTSLLATLLDHSGSRLRMWAIGDPPAARALAARSGMVVIRELLVMHRSLDDPIEPSAVPAGVELRSFVVGADEDAWLQVNARAFADHPEQGRISRADLEERMSEPWFDPMGFLLAERDGRVVGFHWTKRHPDRVGEVYVLGVDPAAGGAGLGRALLAAGLEHLRATGNRMVKLYVEAEHDRAVRLYEGYGFVVATRDVMYAPRDRAALGEQER